MERLATQEKRNGISRTALRLWGMFFIALGICGQGLIQNRLLGMGTVSTDQLLQAMTENDTVMGLVTASLALQAVQTCGVPIFCFLLVEGFLHTKNAVKYLLRVAGVAALSELPYNLAMSGSLWDASSRNPAFGLAMALLMLVFYQRFGGKGFGAVMLKLLITFAAILWCAILSIRDGQCCVLMVALLWACRNAKHMKSFAGCVAAACCTVFSPFYLAAPMGVLAIHGYRGDRGEENRLVNYLAYPALLLAVGLAGMFLM